MKKIFNPIKDKSGVIIEYLMSSPDIPIDDSLQFKLRLVIEEAVDNIVRYAYDEGIGWMEAGIEYNEGYIQVKLRDAGVPFNPLDKEEPDINASLEERKVGGLGIFLCKQLMDEVSYQYVDGCNVLEMKKTISNM